MSKKILIVDDEADIRDYLGTLLEDNGYEVRKAEDGEVGLKMLQEERADLVTLDIVMPNKTGVRLYREMKGSPEFKDIPVLFISGLGDFKVFMKKIGPPLPDPSAFLEKPLDEKGVLDAVGKVFG